MTPLALSVEAAPTRRERRFGRAPLAMKLAIAFLGLVAFVLIVNGAVDTYLTYNQAKRAALEVEAEKARGATERVSAFLADIQTELGWTTGVEWGYAKPDQQRYDFIRLLRQAPAITALSYIDGHGKEQLAVSRLEPDSTASGKDFAADPRFVRAVAEKIWFGPVEFRRGSEPYMTIALAHVGKTPGVTVADVNLKLVWDVVSAIHVGANGFAYVVDDRGRLIAHPDLSLVLRDSDFSSLPQVAEAMKGPGGGAAEVAKSLDGAAVLTAFAIEPKTHWAVFVEQPLSEALAAAYATLARAAGLLGLGLVLAAVTGVALARALAAPIRALQAGAERLGAGDLSQRLDIRTGDEIEALAGGFNQMAGRLQESYENLEGKVEARTKDLNEALAQQTATADVLKVISRSAFDLQIVLDTLVQSAVKLCDVGGGMMYLRSPDWLVVKAQWNPVSEGVLRLLAQRPQKPGRGSIGSRILLTGELEEVPNILEDSEYDPELKAAITNRALLGVPLKRDGETIGAFVLGRANPGRFTRRQIELLQTFADQAVIAIENARLFEEVQAKTRDLEESLAQQTATADVLKVISRSAFGLKTVLQTLVDSAVRLCASDGVIYLRHGDEFRAEAAFGYDADGLGPRINRDPRRPGRGSVTGRVALSRQVEQIPDNLADPDFKVPDAQRMKMRALLGVPLMRDGEVEGVFVLGKPEPGLFGDRVVELVRTFADQAVIAIENARLFEEVQAKTRDLTEALVHQTASSNILKVIASSPTSVAPALQAIVDSACEVCGAYDAAVNLREGDFVRFSAHRGPIPLGIEGRPLSRRWVGGRAILDRAAVHVADLQLAGDEFPEGSEMALRMGHRAILAVPLLREGDSIGAIVVRRTEANPFTEKQVELLRSFADQAVIAIGNVRLFDEVQARTRDVEQALKRQTATSEILRVISESPTDAKPVFDRIVETAAKLLRCDLAFVMLTDGKEWWGAALAVPAGLVPELVRDKFPVDAAANFPARAILSKAMLHLPDWSEIELPAHEAFVQSHFGINSSLHLPFIREGECIGVLVLASKTANAFGPADIAQAESFRDQAVIAIQNARLFNETKEALERQTATSRILEVIASSPTDATPVFSAIADSAKSVMRGFSTTVWQFIGDAAHLVAFTKTDPEAEAALKALSPMTVSGNIKYKLVRNGESVAVVDTEAADADPDMREVARRRGWRSSLNMPLQGRGSVLGFISVTRAAPGSFSEQDFGQLRSFANQAVIAIENARLFEEVQSRTRDLEESLAQQTATADVLKVISRSAFDLDAILKTLVTSAMTLCRAEAGQIFKRGEDGKYRYAASNMNVASEYIEHERNTVIAPGRGTLIGRVALDKATVRIVDAWADEEYEEKAEAHIGGVRSMLGVPLLRDGEPIGAFALARHEPTPFTKQQVDLVSTFADQAVIAIENARLFTETQEALERQTATADILKVIASSPDDVQPVFDAITARSKRLVDALSAAVYTLLDGVIHQRAFTPTNPEADAKLAAMFPRRLADFPFADHILKGEVYALPDTDADPVLRDLARLRGFRSNLFVPLLRDDVPIGMISVTRARPGPFADHHVELLRTFADQAVIAINNVQLFNETKEALQQQTATADVLKVISRSAFDLDAIFQTLVTTAVDLCKASSGTLCVRDGDVFRYRGMAGPEATLALQRYLVAHPLDAPTRQTAAGRAILSRQTEQIEDVTLEEDYAVPMAAQGSPARSLLAVPLLGKSAVLGAIVVARAEPGAFPSRHVEILRTFADQAVIAIENSRLFEEVQSRTRELEQSLADLRKTQDRLVQSEKLASLGQLTAGIAHEIKNPLNFVNNFATLSRELLEELGETLQRLPDDAKADADELMGMIDSNLDKVAHHGKRADSIVKNMLLHSREGSGERTSVNVNAMVEEALNLAYHGARAEKPGFNVTIEKALDPDAGEAELYLQEVTRVLLNLIANGFYATTKRREAEPAHVPTIMASTRDLGDHVEISIRDNGTGIPDEVKAKMFNPFFTTKPAGEGTGLGLSLSHDIVVKQHGGTMEVETKSGEFTEFKIKLPRKAAAS